MKQITIFLICIFGAVSLPTFAQGLKVSVVNDAEEPLIGAYIYVNEEAVAVTDTLGWAVISQGNINLGDSISVSYVATKGQSVVFDQDIRTKREYEFILEENHGSLLADEVNVKADIKRLYDRTVRKLPPYSLYGLYSTHLTINITNPGDSVPSHWVAGRVEGVHTSHSILKKILPLEYIIGNGHSFFNPDTDVLDTLQRAGLHLGFVNGYPLEITTNDDTTGLEQTLKYVLPRALRANYLALTRVHNPEEYAWVNYGYLGKDQHHRTFRLSYNGVRVGTPYNVVVKADVESHEIQEITLNFKDTINGNNYYVKSKVRATKIWEHMCTSFGSSMVWLVPFELEYRIKESDGTVINITMSNINISSLFDKMKLPVAEIFSRNPQKYLFSGNIMQSRLDFYYHEIKFYLERVANDKKRQEERQQRKGAN